MQGLDASASIECLSPLRHERFSEYRDGASISKCKIDLEHRSLADFWRTGGSVWDGLARTSRDDVLLIEATAHIPELVSARSSATEPARGKIAARMKAGRGALAPHSLVEWTSTFYQYANRIARPHSLRELFIGASPLASTA